jgi:hypothetical protein
VSVVVGDEIIDGMRERDECCLQWLSYPGVETACSFADDLHYVVLKDEEPSTRKVRNGNADDRV